ELPEAKRRREPMLLTVGQVHKLADAAPTSDDRNLILVAAFTGLRIGEAFGLGWENVNLNVGNETILVAEQGYQGELVPPPKPPSGFRQIPPAAAATEPLRPQQVERTRPNPLGLVFPSAEAPLKPQSTFTRRVWQATRKAAKPPQLVSHALRH